MGYYGLCKICNSVARTEIESLYGTATYARIIEQVNAKYPELRLQPANLSNHLKHLSPAIPSEEQKVETKPPATYSFESIESMPDLAALDVIDFKIKEIWAAQRTRKLSPAEEQLLRAFVELKVRAESLNLSKSAILQDKTQIEAELKARELLERLNGENSGTKSSSTQEAS